MTRLKWHFFDTRALQRYVLSNRNPRRERESALRELLSRTRTFGNQEALRQMHKLRKFDSKISASGRFQRDGSERFGSPHFTAGDTLGSAY